MEQKSKIRVCHLSSAHKNTDRRIFEAECTSLAKAGYEVYFIGRGKSRSQNGVKVIGLTREPRNRLERMIYMARAVYKKALELDDVKMLFNIVPESARYLVERPIEEIAKTTVFNNKPDVICVSGTNAGAATDVNVLKKVKDALADTAVFANTGCREETIEDILKIADGAVVGTTFKKDGRFENQVDQERVLRFMERVERSR